MLFKKINKLLNDFDHVIRVVDTEKLSSESKKRREKAYKKIMWKIVEVTFEG